MFDDHVSEINEKKESEKELERFLRELLTWANRIPEVTIKSSYIIKICKRLGIEE